MDIYDASKVCLMAFASSCLLIQLEFVSGSRLDNLLNID